MRRILSNLFCVIFDILNVFQHTTAVKYKTEFTAFYWRPDLIRYSLSTAR